MTANREYLSACHASSSVSARSARVYDALPVMSNVLAQQVPS
ncbi:hypothetical protein [Nonomuraea sp. CA-141351]